jgi:hypothetical protein
MLPILTYPMRYNVIPPFVPLDPSLYPTYPIGTKGFDSSIFKNYTCYVPGNVYLLHGQFVGNQFPVMVQLITNRAKQPI